jgi:hypothetical protein
MISLPPHPNVVRMYGVSIDGPQPIIVMEYFAGELGSHIFLEDMDKSKNTLNKNGRPNSYHDKTKET